MSMPAVLSSSPPGTGRVAGGCRVLVVDDEEGMVRSLCAALELMGHKGHPASSIEEAIAAAESAAAPFDIVLTDRGLAGHDGCELLRRFHERWPLTIGIMVTGRVEPRSAVDAMRAGAFDFVPKPVDLGELRLAIGRASLHRAALLEAERSREALAEMARTRGEELDKALRHLDTAYHFMLESLVTLLEKREKATGRHTRRVTSVALVLADALAVDPATREVIRRGAELHDIGKVAIPDAILLKPGKLDDEERAVMRTHAEIGWAILRSNPYLANEAELVRSHHEWYDGRGYPRGLRGEEICLGARVFAVADAYDAIRAVRPYSPAHTHAESLAIVREARGTQFDPAVVDALERHQDAVDRAWIEAEEDNP